jgi:transketolase
VATRKAYGEVLASLIPKYPEIFVLDAEVKNSTFAEMAAQKFPNHYAEMFIAEQNMVGVAVGLAQRGRIPFLSSFAAFLTRAFDQFRMAAVTGANLKCVGSHVGVSIGEDGPSQMGLEDIAMFRAIHGSTVLYPADAVATAALMEQMVNTQGIFYLRTSRPATPVIYPSSEKFPIGGSKVVKSSVKDQVTVVAAGVTLYEALKAYDQLQKEGISIRVVDAYSVKPIDTVTLRKVAQETKALVVVEDHWFEGGLGDAVLNAFAEQKSVPIYKLAVTHLAGSGKPEELVEAAGISASAIVKKVKSLL